MKNNIERAKIIFERVNNSQIKIRNNEKKPINIGLYIKLGVSACAICALIVGVVLFSVLKPPKLID